MLLKRAVHFGAGNIGRGFLGQLYCESGYATVFIDVESEVVDALNSRGSYTVDLVSDEGTETRTISAVSAVHASDPDKAAVTLAQASIASTAVGMHALPHIAPVIAASIPLRFSDPHAQPLDIILCENIHDGEAHMRALVRKHLPADWHQVLDEKVGFVEASIGRMVPTRTRAQQEADILAVAVEPYCELPVDAHAFRGALPPVKHLLPTANFKGYVERKLFVHNLTHAATAYLGYRRGYTYISEAIRDAEVRKSVEGAGLESCRALVQKHGLDAESLESHRQDLIRRYHNRALADQVERVARDPRRKLGRDDRLIGAMLLCLDQGIVPDSIASVTAAALTYDNPVDPVALELQKYLRASGLDAVLKDICRIDPGSDAAGLIKKYYNKKQSTN